MAKKILVDLNLNKNELQNAVVQNLPSDPSSPVKGLIYFNTTSNRFRIYDGEVWEELGTGSGTVTSVGIVNSDGSLTVSGSPVTKSGNITVEHANTIEAMEEPGLYPIAYDKNGHITAIGEKLGTVSATADGLMPANKTDNQDANTPIAEEDLLYDATTGKYQKLPEEAFKDTTYTDGSAGFVEKAKQDQNGNVIDTYYAPLESPEFTGTPTAPKATAGDNSSQIATTSFVAEAVSSVAGAMHFKGTVGGDGATVSELPSEDVKAGDTYKVAEDGEYDSKQAKVGDLFIAQDETPTWAYVPSGDDTGVTSITAGAGLTGGTITSTGTIALDKSGVTAGEYNGITVDDYGRVTAAEDKGYTTNEGTVTSVGITAGAGLSVSGSPITENGSITVGHKNSVEAQTTQAVYPIKIDSEGHISAYGTAATLLKKYAGDIVGDDSTTEFAITHSLGSKDVTVQVYDKTTNEDVVVDITRTSDTVVTISFASAPAEGQDYRVVVIG